jgi:hypothetical protein
MDPRRFASSRFVVSFLFVAAAFTTSSALAQQAATDAADAAARTTQAMERIDREIACLRAQRERLARLQTLIAEADAQSRTSAHGAREREEGAAAIASLRAQAADAERAAKLCLEPGAAFATGETMQVADPVVARPLEPVAARLARLNGTADAHAAHLGTTSPALAQDTARLVERDIPLAGEVRVVRGVHTGGAGTLEHGVVRAAVRAIGPRLAACYERMVERGALREGTLALVFDVTGGGRPTRVSVTRTDHGDYLDDVTLGQCVRQAGDALRFSQAPRGGTATFTYTLRFGG